MTYLTYHSSMERTTRNEFIIDNIGLGEPFCSCISTSHIGTEEILTTTGILVIRSLETKRIVTFFPCTAKRAVVVYRQALNYDKARLPKSMYDKIQKNIKLFKDNNIH